jgi:beta-phosphoglucomutase
MALSLPTTAADTWLIREPAFDPELAARHETIFFLGNGTLGMRGNFEEGFPGGVTGTYVNGFYDETPIVYGEIAHAYAKNRQVMLNVADGKRLRLTLQGERFDLSTGTILEYERTLDLARGLLSRTVRWRSPSGRIVDLSSRRLVSLARAHVAAIDWAVTCEGTECAVEIDSSIDGTVANRAPSGTDPRIGAHFRERPLSNTVREANGMRGLLQQVTRGTGFTLACAMEHGVSDDRLNAEASVGSDRATILFRGALSARSALRITKYLAYCTSRDRADGACAERAQKAAEEARRAGFDALLAEQEAVLAKFWDSSDIEIEGDHSLQQGLRFNLFSLYQSAGRDGRTSIAAKGLSGEGYEGHYFWDTEIYVLPFFTYTQPALARALVGYRLGILDKARARAAEMSQRGALFPWRTIGGEETSPYYPAGTAQYHIDADVAHAFDVYMDATGDTELLLDGGAEMLFETARLWADLGTYIPRRDGAFCINEVTGPDEYTVLVNNNLYTNMMARENLESAARAAEELSLAHSVELARIAGAIGLREQEVSDWRRAAAAMYIPFDRELGIHQQDDSFLERKRWDFEGVPAESYPLLLHYHPLVIYRHQVLKQPDVVLAQVLLGNRFSMAEKKRNFDFYNPLTTGDSSLSPCIQSVAAAELGYTEMAYGYFSRTARMDLDDVNGNVEDGVHTAAMAGTWISIVRGFAGMRTELGRLSFRPRLPRRWNRVRFRLRYRGRAIEVDITHESATYALRESEATSVLHRGREVMLTPGIPVTVSLLPALECVIFDLDGVLTDTAELHFQAWKRLAEERGIPFDRKVNEELKGVGRMESLGIILRRAGVSMTAPEMTALADKKNAAYRELISAITPADLLPGAGRLLEELREKGIRTALASVSHNAAEVARRLGIEDALDHVVDPRDVVKGKPDPEIFFRAAEALGVPLEDCAGVEDARAGIAAIKAAGMFAVGIGTDLPGADWVVPQTGDLRVEELARRFRERT